MKSVSFCIDAATWKIVMKIPSETRISGKALLLYRYRERRTCSLWPWGKYTTRLPTGGKETNGPAQACHNSELILFCSPAADHTKLHQRWRELKTRDTIIKCEVINFSKQICFLWDHGIKYLKIDKSYSIFIFQPQ